MRHPCWAQPRDVIADSRGGLGVHHRDHGGSRVGIEQGRRREGPAHGASTRITSAPDRLATSHMRSPKRPLTPTTTGSPGRTKLTNEASIPAEPVPLMGRVNAIRGTEAQAKAVIRLVEECQEFRVEVPHHRTGQGKGHFRVRIGRSGAHEEPVGNRHPRIVAGPHSPAPAQPEDSQADPVDCQRAMGAVGTGGVPRASVSIRPSMAPCPGSLRMTAPQREGGGGAGLRHQFHPAVGGSRRRHDAGAPDADNPPRGRGGRQRLPQPGGHRPDGRGVARISPGHGRGGRHPADWSPPRPSVTPATGPHSWMPPPRRRVPAELLSGEEEGRLAYAGATAGLPPRRLTTWSSISEEARPNWWSAGRHDHRPLHEHRMRATHRTVPAP